MLYRWGRNCPFSFFFLLFFACLYAVTTCRNQKRPKSEKTNKQQQENPTETALQRISFEIKQKKTSERAGRERMKPVGIGVGFFSGGGGEQLPGKETTRELQTGKGMVFFCMVY